MLHKHHMVRNLKERFSYQRVWFAASLGSLWCCWHPSPICWWFIGSLNNRKIFFSRIKFVFCHFLFHICWISSNLGYQNWTGPVGWTREKGIGPLTDPVLYLDRLWLYAWQLSWTGWPSCGYDLWVMAESNWTGPILSLIKNNWNALSSRFLFIVCQGHDKNEKVIS